MLLEILPAKLYSLNNVQTLLHNQNSSIFHKTLTHNLIEKEMYLSSIAILYVIQGKQVISNHETKVIVEQGQLLYLSKDMYLVLDFVTDQGQFEAVIFFINDNIEKDHSQRFKKNKAHCTIPTLIASKQTRIYIHSLINVYAGFANDPDIVELSLN